MKQIKKFGIAKTARIIAIIYFIIALLIAVPMGVMTAVAGKFATFIVFIPFLFAAVAYIQVAIICFVYNWLAAKVGGIEIEVE
jgi:membrane protein YdbS with pleckstrin-like domain